MIKTCGKFLLVLFGLALALPERFPAQTGTNAMHNPYRKVETWGDLPEGVFSGELPSGSSQTAAGASGFTTAPIPRSSSLIRRQGRQDLRGRDVRTGTRVLHGQRWQFMGRR